VAAGGRKRAKTMSRSFTTDMSTSAAILNVSPPCSAISISLTFERVIASYEGWQLSSYEGRRLSSSSSLSSLLSESESESESEKTGLD
jgi:hypothetical protein